MFLNFLIAVIGDVYEQVMETRTEEIFKRKAQLLVEIQNVIGDYNRSEMAQILITRSGVRTKVESSWNGMLSEIKKAVMRRTDALEGTLER